MTRLRLYSSKNHGRPPVDDRRKLSGTVLVNRNGLRCRYAPKALRVAWGALQPGEALGRAGRFPAHDVGAGVNGGRTENRHNRCDHLKARRTASSLRVKTGLGRLIGRTKGGVDTKLHANRDADGCLSVADLIGEAMCWHVKNEPIYQICVR